MKKKAKSSYSTSAIKYDLQIPYVWLDGAFRSATDNGKRYKTTTTICVYAQEISKNNYSSWELVCVIVDIEMEIYQTYQGEIGN